MFIWWSHVCLNSFLTSRNISLEFWQSSSKLMTMSDTPQHNLCAHFSIVNHIWVHFWGLVVYRAASRVHTRSAERSRGPQQTESAVPQRDWAGSGILWTSAQTAQHHASWCGENTNTHTHTLSRDNCKPVISSLSFAFQPVGDESQARVVELVGEKPGDYRCGLRNHWPDASPTNPTEKINS